jgi:hypothetical protein
MIPEVPYSHPRLNELEDGYWVIEVYTYQGNTYYFHDPELKTVSGFDGAYRYADKDVGIKELKRHRSAFMKRHGEKGIASGKFVRVTPTYVSVHYAGEVLKKKLGYFPASGTKI